MQNQKERLLPCFTERQHSSLCQSNLGIAIVKIEVSICQNRLFTPNFSPGCRGGKSFRFADSTAALVGVIRTFEICPLSGTSSVLDPDGSVIYFTVSPTQPPSHQVDHLLLQRWRVQRRLPVPPPPLLTPRLALIPPCFESNDLSQIRNLWQ